jgi:DNA-binding NarL/FixJ family response regulator
MTEGLSIPGFSPDSPLSVVIVDDHALFSRGLELLLNTTAGSSIRVVGRTEDAGAALDLVRRLRPQLAIIDLAMPPPGGVEAIRQVKHDYPKVRVLALSGTDQIDFAISALRAGADGFMLKSSEPDLLIPPLLSLAMGVSVLPKPLLTSLLRSGDRPGKGALDDLSEDEQTLWLLIAKGLETNEIAERLFASDRTVKRMVASLLRKIGAANRLEAAALAGRSGLLDEPPEDLTAKP